MDVATHLRAIWQRRYLVLGGALLVGLAVFALRAFTPVTYTSTAVLFVVPGGGEVADVQGEIRRLTAAYADLVDDEQVLSDTAAATGLSPNQVGRLTQVASAEGGQVAVTATGDSPEASAELANAVAGALSAGAAREQEQAVARELAPLDAEIEALQEQIEADDSDAVAGLTARQQAVFQSRVQQLSQARARLDVVNAARPASAVSAPRPARDAVLAFLLALIVQAELAALLAARRAGLEGRDPVKVLREWSELPVFRMGDSRRGPDQSAAALLHVRSSAAGAAADVVVSLAPTSDPASTDAALARMLEAGVAAYGSSVLVDLRGHGAGTEVLPPGTSVVTLSRSEVDDVLRGAARPVSWGPFAMLVAQTWEDSDFLLLTCALDASTLVVVDAETVRRPDLQQTIATLNDARTPARGVLVVDRAAAGRRWRSGSPAPVPPPGAAPLDRPGAAPSVHGRRDRRRSRRRDSDLTGPPPVRVPSTDPRRSPEPASPAAATAPPRPTVTGVAPPPAAAGAPASNAGAARTATGAPAVTTRPAASAAAPAAATPAASATAAAPSSAIPAASAPSAATAAASAPSAVTPAASATASAPSAASAASAPAATASSAPGQGAAPQAPAATRGAPPVAPPAGAPAPTVRRAADGRDTGWPTDRRGPEPERPAAAGSSATDDGAGTTGWAMLRRPLSRWSGPPK
jgi:capsular polysaccharide biosynthesis protein